MDGWLEDVASALGVDPLSPRERERILRFARDVAHGVERTMAPLSAYLVGLAAGRSGANDEAREQALDAVIDAIRPLIPASTNAAGSDQRRPRPPAG